MSPFGDSVFFLLFGYKLKEVKFHNGLENLSTIFYFLPSSISRREGLVEGFEEEELELLLEEEELELLLELLELDELLELELLDELGKKS